MSRSFRLLLTKDLKSELREKESLALLITLSFILSVLAAFGVKGAFLERQIILALYPTLLWLIFFISGSVSVGRSFEYEDRWRAIDGVLLSGVSEEILLTSKIVSNFIISLAGYTATALSLAILLNTPLIALMPQGVLLGVLVILGYVPLATLLAAGTFSTRLKGVLLPVITIPLLVPLFLAGIELFAQLIETSSIAFGSPWFSLLVIFDAAYLLATFFTFRFIIRD